MKKTLLILVAFIFIMVPSSNIEALSPSEIVNRSECPKVELAEAKTDGTLSKIECYETYQDAKNIMNATDNDNLVIIESGMIVDAKYAVVDYDIDYPSGHKGYIDIYTNSTGSTTNGYVRGGTPDEAAMIEVDYNTKRVRIKISGINGWINKYDGTLKLYDIVPIAWVKTPQYYQVTNDSLIHYYPGNAYGTKGTSSLTIDKKPNMLNVGNYYSYDGNYFYTNMKTMLQDYKNGNYNQAINKDTPYYNYYQYVSFRTKTNYTLENIDQYLSKRTSDTSKMRSTGTYFIDVQNKYGVNAALMMAIGMNESGRGTSTIAQTKNNLFGLNAIDADPLQASNYFATVGDCINDYGYAWLAYGFLDPRDYRYYGANLGNKYQGLNYKYASDPFWAEKAAHYYYDLDSMFGFQDRDSYQIAVLNNNYSNVYAKKTIGGENISSYKYKLKGSSIVILEEMQGPEINGNKTWYKIQADGMLDDNLNIIGSSKDNPRVTYNWEKNFAYVPAAYFTKVNIPTAPVPSTPGTTTPSTPSTPTVPETPPAKQVSAIVTEASYKYENGNISGINPGTSIETVKNKLTSTGGVITVTDINGNTKESGNIGTGDKINITSGVTETLNVLIYGDINGDGNISAVDYVNVKNHIMGSNVLNNVYTKAADVNSDGNISAVDYVNIKNYIMGTDNVIKN